MRRWHWIAGFLCAALTALAVWQSQQLRTVPAGESAAAESDHPAADGTGVPTNSDESARELARLRNEVTQLRARGREIEAARQENAALIRAKQAGLPPGPPPGFVARDSLANKGFGTPDNAVQTFFWAMREGNFDAAMECLSLTSPQRQRMEKLSPDERASMEREFKAGTRESLAAHLTDVGVRNREVISDDVVVLHVGSSVSTNTMRIRAERTPEGWKLLDPL